MSDDKVAVVCHDAGAANLVFAWIREWGWPVIPFMQGPAAQLWQAIFPGTLMSDSLEEALTGSTQLISGTGWASRLEHDARVLAASMGIHSVGVIDHWVNYPQRFERDGQIQLPDELWVADECARIIAEDVFVGIPVMQFENLYLKGQLQKIRPAPGGGTVLYVLEPVRNTWGRKALGEFQALDFALQHINKLLPSGVTQIILRPHPSEALDKYARYLTIESRIRMDNSFDLAQAINLADAVVGIESFALTIALAAGRPVFSSLPPWAPALRLPHEGIQQIRRLYSI